jgi:hypothetical protein
MAQLRKHARFAQTNSIVRSTASSEYDNGKAVSLNQARIKSQHVMRRIGSDCHGRNGLRRPLIGFWQQPDWDSKAVAEL